MKLHRLVPSKTLVAVIDAQEALAAAMPPERISQLVRNIGILLSGAKVLGADVVATEQYPKGLGKTLPPLAAKLTDLNVVPIEKTAFSAVDVPELLSRVEAVSPAAVVIVGMEAHVCVYQTARDLVNRGLDVYVAIDAVCSRREEDRATGIALCERAGATRTTTEAVVFDWLQRAGTDAFRTMSKLVR